jgi:hypothetical protein
MGGTINRELQREHFKLMRFYFDLKCKTFWSKAFAVGDEEWVESQLQNTEIKRKNVVNLGEISFAIGVNQLHLRILS